MNGQFNPLQSKLLFTKPRRLHLKSGWVEHIPFAMLLVELQPPRMIVEVGTHWGVPTALGAKLWPPLARKHGAMQ